MRFIHIQRCVAILLRSCFTGLVLAQSAPPADAIVTGPDAGSHPNDARLDLDSRAGRGCCAQANHRPHPGFPRLGAARLCLGAAVSVPLVALLW